jgi:uncharacterized protein (DUF2249 family)
METEVARLEIETRIPAPTERYNLLYGFLDGLKVGESVLITQQVNRKSLRACVTYRTQRYNKRFVTRAVEGGFRVWRIS